MDIELFDFSVNILQASIWQYNYAPNLKSIIGSKQTWYTTNQANFWTNFFNNTFNLLTADTFGLSVWARILNVPLFVNIAPEPSGKPLFGFNRITSAGPPAVLENSYQNFGHGDFSTQNGTVILTVEQQRFILRLKYFKLCNDTTIPVINSFLNYLFATSSDITPGDIGTAWALDTFNMQMTYVFTLAINPGLLSVIKMLDLLPRPNSVSINYLTLSDKVFGFGVNNENFENGDFIHGFYNVSDA